MLEFREVGKEESEKVLAEGTPLPLVRLGMDMQSCATEEEMHDNFYVTLKRGYVPLNEHLYRYGGIACVVGAAPSIEKTYKELTGDVCAINSAIGFLIEHGVIPKWAMLWDAADIVEQFAVPHPDITYLVASRCHPKVFERLKDCKVVVWHAGGDHDISKVLNNPEVIAKQKYEEPLINGGSAGVTRGIFLMTALGYKEIHLFGADSSYGTQNNTHVRGSLVPEKDFLIAIGNEPPLWFRTTPEWCAQVEEYKCIYALMVSHDIKLEVHGDGMLPTMHQLLVAKRELRGHEQFMKDVAAQEEERKSLDAMASKANAERLGETQIMSVKEINRLADYGVKSPRI